MSLVSNFTAQNRSFQETQPFAFSRICMFTLVFFVFSLLASYNLLLVYHHSPHGGCQDVSNVTLCMYSS
jgi:hypothetical protein